MSAWWYCQILMCIVRTPKIFLFSFFDLVFQVPLSREILAIALAKIIQCFQHINAIYEKNVKSWFICWDCIYIILTYWLKQMDPFFFLMIKKALKEAIQTWKRSFTISSQCLLFTFNLFLHSSVFTLRLIRLLFSL